MTHPHRCLAGDSKCIEVAGSDKAVAAGAVSAVKSFTAENAELTPPQVLFPCSEISSHGASIPRGISAAVR
jgi:hypothetical protein